MPAGLDLWSGALFGCQAPKHAGLGNAASNPPALLWDVLCSLKPGKDLAWTFAGVHMWLLWLPCWSAMICSTSSELRFALAKGSYSRQSPTFWGRCTSDCCSFRNAWMQRFLECHVNIVIYPLCTVQICATHRSPNSQMFDERCCTNHKSIWDVHPILQISSKASPAILASDCPFNSTYFDTLTV